MIDISSDTDLSLDRVVMTAAGFPRAIAITGEKFHGKDTVAKAIIARTGAKLVRFADGLKGMMRAFYAECGLPADEIERRIEGDLKEEACVWLGGRTPRHAMQTLGTEWRQLIWNRLWVNQQEARVKAHTGTTVTPDMRFLIEEEAVDAVGGLKIRVVNPRIASNESSTHASEIEMRAIKVHYTLVNDGTIEDLFANVDELLESLSALRAAA